MIPLIKSLLVFFLILTTATVFSQSAEEADTFSFEGKDLYERCRYAQSLEYYKRALAIDEASRRKAGIAADLNNIGEAYLSLGRYAEALACLERALAITETLGRRPDIALQLNNIGGVYWRLEDFERAVAYFSRSVELLEQLRLTAPGAIRRDYLASQIVTYRWLTSAFIRGGKPSLAFDTVELASAKYLIEQMSEELDKRTIRFVSIDEYRGSIPENTAVLNYANVNWSGIIASFSQSQNASGTRKKRFVIFQRCSISFFSQASRRSSRKRRS